MRGSCSRQQRNNHREVINWFTVPRRSLDPLSGCSWSPNSSLRQLHSAISPCKTRADTIPYLDELREVAMVRKRFVFVAVTITVLASTLLVPALGADVTSKNSPQSQSSVGASYAPLPTAAYTAAGVRLDPLQNSQLTAIQVSASDAIAIAEARLGLTPAASNVAISVGSFTDDQYVTINATGTRHLVANDLPAYVVTFSGLSIASQGRSSTINTENNVVVNAATGEIVEEFSYR